MLDLLRRYFFTFHELCLPGLGMLEVKKTPPAIDFPNRQLTAPVHDVQLLPYAEGREAAQLRWLSQQQHTDAGNVAAALSSFCASVKEQLAEGSEYMLPSIGTFSLSPSGNISFRSVLEAGVYTAPVVAEKVIREADTHMVMVGDTERTSTEMEAMLSDETSVVKEYWWIAAIALIIVAAASWWYFNDQHQAQSSHHGNYHRLQPKEAPATYRPLN